ncbi:hypothetical protein [Aeromonas veronii]|uniref:hypothetical protein n=1 Tax=Aeromonas veronii TaxID=654 RepID=UPI000390AE5C|nr:hypothetical protein [Aeromonas veronii]QMS78809.1 hypothetical protein M001_021770 [Aeromonas veronii Hm21]
MRKGVFVRVNGVQVEKCNEAAARELLAAEGKGIPAIAARHHIDPRCLHAIAARCRKLGILPALEPRKPAVKKIHDGTAHNRRAVIAKCVKLGTEYFFSCLAETEANNFTQTAVLRCLKGKVKDYAGLEWRYATMEEIARYQLNKRKAA